MLHSGDQPWNILVSMCTQIKVESLNLLQLMEDQNGPGIEQILPFSLGLDHGVGHYRLRQRIVEPFWAECFSPIGPRNIIFLHYQPLAEMPCTFQVYCSLASGWLQVRHAEAWYVSYDDGWIGAGSCFQIGRWRPDVSDARKSLSCEEKFLDRFRAARKPTLYGLGARWPYLIPLL